MKLTCLICSAVCALVLGTVPALASPSDLGNGDPFEITFNANGTATINACTSACTTGPITGTAVTNVGGEGGNGFEFALPESVVSGCCVAVLNSSNVLSGILDFVDSTDLAFLTSGTLSNYAELVTVTADANGNFTYLGPYPSNNQYNGTLASATPEPSSLTLLGSGFAALAGVVGRRRRRE
jgi:hypothetical protein